MKSWQKRVISMNYFLTGSGSLYSELTIRELYLTAQTPMMASAMAKRHVKQTIAR